MCCFLGFFFGEASGKLFETTDVFMVGAKHASEERTLIADGWWPKLSAKDDIGWAVERVEAGLVFSAVVDMGVNVDCVRFFTSAVILCIEWLIGLVGSGFSLKV